MINIAHYLSRLNRLNDIRNQCPPVDAYPEIEYRFVATLDKQVLYNMEIADLLLRRIYTTYVDIEPIDRQLLSDLLLSAKTVINGAYTLQRIIIRRAVYCHLNVSTRLLYI